MILLKGIKKINSKTGVQINPHNKLTITLLPRSIVRESNQNKLDLNSQMDYLAQRVDFLNRYKSNFEFRLLRDPGSHQCSTYIFWMLAPVWADRHLGHQSYFTSQCWDQLSPPINDVQIWQVAVRGLWLFFQGAPAVCFRHVLWGVYFLKPMCRTPVFQPQNSWSELIVGFPDLQGFPPQCRPELCWLWSNHQTPNPSANFMYHILWITFARHTASRSMFFPDSIYTAECVWQGLHKD